MTESPENGLLNKLTYSVSAGPDARDGSPVALLLHGRGAHRGDLQALRDRLPDDFVLVTPQAPHPGHPWGYGPGWAWYRYLAEDRVDEPTLEASLGLLDGFVDQLAPALPVTPGHLFLGGFSQGGTTSVAWALSRPGRVDGVLNFSGFLVDGAVTADLGHAPSVPIFWGHGTRDPNIPFALAEKGRARLDGAGARITTVDAEIGHWIGPGVFSEAVNWMRGIVDAGVRGD